MCIQEFKNILPSRLVEQLLCYETSRYIEMQILDIASLRKNNGRCIGEGHFIRILNPTSNFAELGHRVRLGVSTKLTFQVWPLEQNIKHNICAIQLI